MSSPLTLAPWLTRYHRRDFLSDLLAGLTVAVMLVPQGMAYAMLAGMPPVAGLYASTLPLVAYALLGSSRALAVGPVAIVSLLTLAGVAPLAEPGSTDFIALAGILALMVGGLQLALGLLRGGVLVAFLSHAVVSGFTSAAALVIALSQVHHLLGFSLAAKDPVPVLLEAFQRLGEVHSTTLLLGLSSLILLLAGRRWSPRVPMPLVVVVLGTLTVALAGLDQAGVKIVGAVPAGLPRPSLPQAPSEDSVGPVPHRLDHRLHRFPGVHRRGPVAGSAGGRTGGRRPRAGGVGPVQPGGRIPGGLPGDRRVLAQRRQLPGRSP